MTDQRTDGVQMTEQRPRRLSRVESILLSEGLISEESLAAARGRQQGAKRPLMEILLEQGAVAEEDLVRVFAEASGMKVVEASALHPDPAAQKHVPAEIAQRLGILPLRVEDGVLVVATPDPFQIMAFDELAARTNLRVRPVFAAPSAVRGALREIRAGEETLDDILKHAPAVEDLSVLPVGADDADAPDALSVVGEDADGPVDTEDEENEETVGALALDSSEDEDAPVIQLLNLMLADAIRTGASDIHIEPEKDKLRVRFRVDGELRRALDLPTKVKSRLLARLKIVSNLSTIETRRPQDGRAKVVLNNRTYDLRISTLPSYFGEKAVIRILDPQAQTFSLDRSGIDEPLLETWRGLLRRPQGLLLVTGPTGSGKSTTLYASLLELRSPKTNIVTVEDPVEYQFPGIVHVPVRSDIGMTFGTALRSILRQDPDIVLLGEIRDHETAEVAVRAAMTGHLVLSTLHTNDAVGALSRLLDLGISPQLLANCLLGVMAQRLVRTVCSSCAEPHDYPSAEVASLCAPLTPEDLVGTRKGRGCSECRGSGSKGRTAIVELIRATPALQTALMDGAREADLLALARREGTKSLYESGLSKFLEGRATPEAVLRVASPDLEATGKAEVVLEEPSAPIAADVAVDPAAAETPPASKPQCGGCGETVRADWNLCPFCGAEVTPTGDGPVAVICDDSPTLRRLVRAAVAPLVDHVEEAEDGKAGLDAVFRTRPDLLVVDQQMPHMMGVDVVRELRSHLETATMLIVMLTACKVDGLESEVLEAGADDYLEKPITVDRLRTRVRALLASRKRMAAPAPGPSVP